MKTILDGSTRGEIVTRINSLNENDKAQWGKMNLYQALKHCTKWDDLMLGHLQAKRLFVGRIFGKWMLKNVLKDDKPLRKNTPTASEMIIKEESGNISLQKTEWIKKISEYEHFDNPAFIHPFFGSMTKEQVGQLVYKHHDHHLRQFGA